MKQSSKHDDSIWIADFGSEDMEQEIKELVRKLAPKKPLKIHWLFLALFVFLIVLAIELLLRSLGGLIFWPEITIFWLVWIFRVALLMLWLYLARQKMRLHRDKILAVAIFAFAAEVLIADIIKIAVIKSVWTWINILVEPIWMILLVGFLFNINKLKKIKK